MESFHVGVRYFFGVTIDDKGMPIHDREQPYKRVFLKSGLKGVLTDE
ncbi:MAG: hypothetical protein Ct9H90mP7_4460 [Candidatus Neomarinimicrobiota bacterium]|nr:MAG: hypothetical protein Ct9H90mP7_4460 [Candidatus Neomarinimicrobiota bacterium]